MVVTLSADSDIGPIISCIPTANNLQQKHQAFHFMKCFHPTIIRHKNFIMPPERLLRPIEHSDVCLGVEMDQVRSSHIISYKKHEH